MRTIFANDVKPWKPAKIVPYNRVYIHECSAIMFTNPLKLTTYTYLGLIIYFIVFTHTSRAANLYKNFFH